MRTLFSALAILFLLLAIVSFIVSLVSLYPALEIAIPGLRGTQRFKTAIGTVTYIGMGSSSRSGSSGNVYKTSEAKVTIQFHDEEGHLCEINCDPIFKKFEMRSSVKVHYHIGEEDSFAIVRAEKWAKESGRDVQPVLVSGTPSSLFLWLERPVLFFVLGVVLLILMLAPIAFRKFYS
jgi:hypothetical protein